MGGRGGNSGMAGKKYGIFVQTGEQNCNGATNSGRSYPCGWKTEQG